MRCPLVRNSSKSPIDLSTISFTFFPLRRRCSMDISSSLASHDTRSLQLLTSDLDVLSCGGVPLSPGACAADVLSSAKEGLFSADPMPTTLRQWPLLSKPSFLHKITTPGSTLPPDGACARAVVNVPPGEPQPWLQGRSKGQEEEEADSQCSLAPYPLFTSPAVRTPTGAKILACAFPQLELPAHVRIDPAPLFAAYYSSAALGSPLPYLCGERGRGTINDPLLDEWAFVLSQEETKAEFYTGMDLKDDAPPQHGAAKASGSAGGNRTLRPATRKREARAADIAKATAASAVAARSPSNVGATATALNDSSPRLKDQLSQVDIGRAGRHESSDDDGGTTSEALIVSGMLMGNSTTAAHTGQPSPRSSSAAQPLAPPTYSTPLQGLDQTVSWPLSPLSDARRTRSQAGGPHIADGHHPARYDADAASGTTAVDESLSWSHDGETLWPPFISAHSRLPLYSASFARRIDASQHSSYLLYICSRVETQHLLSLILSHQARNFIRTMTRWVPTRPALCRTETSGARIPLSWTRVPPAWTVAATLVRPLLPPPRPNLIGTADGASARPPHWTALCPAPPFTSPTKSGRATSGRNLCT